MNIVMLSTEISKSSAFLCKDRIHDLESQLKRERCLSMGLTLDRIRSRRGNAPSNLTFT